MRTILYLTLLILASSRVGPAMSAEPGVRTYRAEMNESQWRSEAGERACHLFHRIPGYGTALFTTSLRDTLALTLFTRRPPERGGTATVIARPPWWRDGPAREIGQARVNPDRAVLKFGHGMTARILAELERGQEVIFRFDSYFDESTVEIILQPVQFGPAHETHLRCLPQVRAATSAGGAGSPTNGTSGNTPFGRGPDGTSADDRAPSRPTPDTRSDSRRGPGANARTGSATNAAVNTSVPRSAKNTGTPAPPGGTGDTGAVKTAQAVPGRQVPDGFPVPPGETIHFVHDNARLDREDLDKINRLARQVAGNPHWSAVLIIGHTDSRGENHYNRSLGLSRARTVRERLIAAGVSPDKIRIQTAGESNPVGSNDSVYGRAENRRVAVQPVL